MSYIIYPTTYNQVSTISLLKEYFPYKKCIPVVNNSNFIKKNEVLPDVSILDNRLPINVPLFSEDLIVDIAIEKIFITSNLEDKKTISFIDNCKNINTEIIGYVNNDFYIDKKDNDYLDFLFFEDCLSLNQKKMFFEINIPIIGVGGLIGYCNQSEITTKLSLELNNNNVSTKALVTEKTHTLLDSIKIPDEIFNDKISFIDKAILLNHYIYFIITKYKCESLIVEVPGGLIKFSNDVINDISQYGYLFIESMPISNFILCVPMNKYNYTFYKNILSIIDNKFKWNTIGIHISNSHVDIESFKHNDPNYLLFRNMKNLKEYTEEISNEAINDNIIIESFSNKDSFNLLVNDILTKFKTI